MESKRIVMTSTFYPPYHLGGDATHVKMLKEQLEARGHEVHVVHSLDAYRLKQGEIADGIEAPPGVHPIEGRWGKWSAVGTYLTGRNRRAERELERLVSEVRPDWVHHHNISLLGSGVLEGCRAPAVYTAHDYWLICPRSDLMYRGKETCTRQRCTSCTLSTGRPPQLWRSWRMGRALEAIDLLIAPSKFMADRLSSFLGLRSEVLSNFAPSPDFKGGEVEGHFSFVGVLERNKGLDLLLEAFQGQGVEAGLHVMGRGSLEPMVKEAERRTDGRISYKGFLTGRSLWSEVAGSRALMCPSTGNENSPLACIEALALGTPLIVSPRGGLPELVADPECGAVSQLTPRALAEAASRLSEPEIRDGLAKNAFIRYQRHHAPGTYVSRYLGLCEAMLVGAH